MGNEVISVVDGVIEKVDVAGEYVSIIPDGGNLRILNVHINLIPVKMGQRVRVGQVIGHIAPNKGGSHLHFGLKWKNPAKPAPCPMDYFDRSIVFRTRYADIKREWFNGEDIDWSKFRDLHIAGESYKLGDYVEFTGSMNLRGGAGTGFKDIRTISKGAVARIKDIRTSQNALFYGRGSDKQVNDGYLWLDGEFDGITGWFAVTSRVKKSDKREITDVNGAKPVAIPEPTPEPTPPVQEPEVCLKCTEWEKRYKEAREKNEGLRVELGALELKYQEEHKALKAEKEKVKILEIEKEDLANDLNVARVEQERAEKERLKLQEDYEKKNKTNFRWNWLVQLLNKIIPEKNVRKTK